MSARPLIILALAAVLLSGVVFFVNRPAEQVAATDTLFAPLLAEKLDDVATVRIIGAGDTTIVSLTRTADDWVVDERDGYRANTNQIRSALTLLSRATIVEAKTANPEQFDRLSVEDLTANDAGGVGIEFLPASLGLPGIILGDASGSSYRFARLADSNQSWLINADPQVPTDTTQWLATQILSIDGGRITRILIEHADGEVLEISRDAPEQPNYSVAQVPEDRSLQYPGVANVIGNVLRNLRLEDVAAAQGDLGAAQMTTRFETFDGLVITARGYQIGNAGWLTFVAEAQSADSDQAVAEEIATINAALSGWRFRIPEYQYSQIGRRMEDLLSAEASEE